MIIMITIINNIQGSLLRKASRHPGLLYQRNNCSPLSHHSHSVGVTTRTENLPPWPVYITWPPSMHNLPLPFPPESKKDKYTPIRMYGSWFPPRRVSMHVVHFPKPLNVDQTRESRTDKRKRKKDKRVIKSHACCFVDITV